MDVYKTIFPNDTFKAPDALADTKALRKVCSESTYFDRIFKEIVSNSRQLSFIRKRALFEVREKQNEQELFQLLKLDTTSKRRAKLGISVQILKEMGSQFGVKRCLSFLSAKPARAKLPRVTRNITELSKIAEILYSEKVYFQRD